MTTSTTHPTKDARWASSPMTRWRERPERMAWFVILASFAVFILLLITIPTSAGYVMQHLTISEPAQLAAQGTILLYPPNAQDAIAITNEYDEVLEGSRIEGTTNSTQGTLDLIQLADGDEALGSIHFYGTTRLTIERVRLPLFERSRQPYRVRIALEAGQIRVFTNSDAPRKLEVELITPYGTALLREGTYRVSVANQNADITVRLGQAALSHSTGHELTLVANSSARMTETELRQEFSAAEQNLIRNNNLPQWDVDTKGTTSVPGQVRFDEQDGRNVAYFFRTSSETVWTEVEIAQEINADIPLELQELLLQLDVKVLFQSLPGAGERSSEFPLRVEIDYTSIYDQELTWGWGFYYRTPDGHFPEVTGGDKIQQGEWYTYESPNLLTLLNDTRPARIKRIRLYASGWSYQSMASEIYLLAK